MKQEQKQALSASFGGSDVILANMTKTQEIKKAQLRVVANFVLKANKIAGTLPN